MEEKQRDAVEAGGIVEEMQNAALREVEEFVQACRKGEIQPTHVMIVHCQQHPDGQIAFGMETTAMSRFVQQGLLTTALARVTSAIFSGGRDTH